MHKKAKNGRFIFVDVHRSLAIMLAISAHAVNDWDITDALGRVEFAALRTITRAANPSFLFMFGMMLELVYARKTESNGLHAVAPRLVQRGYQCYAGYAATFFAAYWFGARDLWTTIQGLFFIFGPPHGDVLKFYAVALVAAVLLLAIRNRHGLRVAVFVCLGLWLIQPVEAWLSQIPIGRFNGLRSFLMSEVPLNTTFVAGGMYLDHALRADSEDISASFHRRAAVTLTACGAVVLVLILMGSAWEVYSSYLDYYEYRASHHIGYYSIGLIQACLLSVFLYHVTPVSATWLQPSSPLLGFGRSSLLSFTLGNIILLSLDGYVAVSPYMGLVFVLAYAGAVLLFINMVETSSERLRRSALAPWVHSLRRFPGRRAIGAVTHVMLRVADYLPSYHRRDLASVEVDEVSDTTMK